MKMLYMRTAAKILVVDDDDEIRSLLQVVLTREGFDVQLAKDAPAARRFLVTPASVDLIILDISKRLAGTLASGQG
jgi:two-component system, OmpR family, response regulator